MRKVEQSYKTLSEIEVVHDTTTVYNRDSAISEVYTIRDPFNLIKTEYEVEKDNLYIRTASLRSSNCTVTKMSNIKLPRSLHQHDYYELMVVLKGTVLQRIEDQKYIYTAGQCCLMNHNIKHVEEVEEDASIAFISFSDEYFDEIINCDMDLNKKDFDSISILRKIWMEYRTKSIFFQKQYIEFRPIAPMEVICVRLDNWFNLLFQETKNCSPGYYSIIKGLIIRMLSYLCDVQLFMCREVKLVSSREEYIFSKIQRVLEEHNGKISREELSLLLNYHPDYINQITKKRCGLSIMNYSRVFSMKYAAQCLISTNESVSCIIQRLGLSNRSYFYKLFEQQFGMTPIEYRKRYALKSEECIVKI